MKPPRYGMKRRAVRASWCGVNGARALSWFCCMAAMGLGGIGFAILIILNRIGVFWCLICRDWACQQRPPSEQIDLVGFSFGSLVGSYVAGHVQKPLKSLTLVGAGALGLIRADITLERTDPLMSEAERRAVHAKNLGLLMIADPAQIDDLAITIQDLNVQLARVKSRRFAKSESLADVLRGVEVGALHSLWGEWDAVAAGRFSERETLLRAIRPDVSFKIIEQGGHWISYERADAFNAYVAGLLKS